MDTIDVFLSPHLDDAVISCGGLIHQLTSHGAHVVIITICTGTPSAAVSHYADKLHRTWHLERPDDVMAIRRQEDRQAVATTGGQAIHLDFLDAIYRRDAIGWLYQSWSELTGPLKECNLAADIARAMLNVVDWFAIGTLYAPLAIGSHVDHQLAHQAARHVATRVPAVLFYEDLPYALGGPQLLTDALQRQFTAAPPLQIVPIGDDDLEANVEAIMCYASQHAFDRATIRTRLKAYRRAATPDGTLVQRLWQLPH